MIPKKIHYVWVGNNPKPKEVLKCINTWKKYMPEYEIIEWNEKNFNINSHPYVMNAYKEKKWAFVSDYIRMYAIYNQGGIYFDTDVIALKSLNDMLENEAFIGYEDKNIPFTAVFGAVPKHPFIKRILQEYDKLDQKYESSATNTKIISQILIDEYNCKLGDIDQKLKDNLVIYNSKTLCKPSFKSKTIHTFSSSWVNKKSWISKLDTKFKLSLDNKFKILLYKFFELLIIKPKQIIRNYINRLKKI